MLPLLRRPSALRPAVAAAAASSHSLVCQPTPAAAAGARALASNTTTASTGSNRRGRGGHAAAAAMMVVGRVPTAAVVSPHLLASPRRGLAAAATAAANPIKAKITGSLIEARDKGVPVEVGMEVELEHTFGPENVQTFAALSGDDNPIHLDHAYATKQGIFKGAIVHGLLVGSLFGTIFGVTFPGCVYLSQSFKFSRPVYVGRPVTAVVEVTRRREREGSSPPSSILFCSTHVIDEDGVAAIAGEAVVMLVHKEKEKGAK